MPRGVTGPNPVMTTLFLCIAAIPLLDMKGIITVKITVSQIFFKKKLISA
jgi:hypothetical protein